MSNGFKNILRRLLHSRGLEIVHCSPNEKEELAGRPGQSLIELRLENALVLRDGSINLREACLLSDLSKRAFRKRADC